MEVRLYPNSRRPGTGVRPKREGTRPLLPQHARHCPVLEAGSAMGFMVYAALDPRESAYLEYEGEGKYKFQVALSLPIGTIGITKEEVAFAGVPVLSKEVALALARAVWIPENTGTPPGAVALRGATNFSTPTGWDTVYSPQYLRQSRAQRDVGERER